MSVRAQAHTMVDIEAVEELQHDAATVGDDHQGTHVDLVTQAMLGALAYSV